MRARKVDRRTSNHAMARRLRTRATLRVEVGRMTNDSPVLDREERSQVKLEGSRVAVRDEPCGHAVTLDHVVGDVIGDVRIRFE